MCKGSLCGKSATEGSSAMLTLTDSLRHRRLVLSPTAYFCQERQKYAKPPFETHGFKTSFPRRTVQFAKASTARENWFVETSPKCCTVSSSPSLVRLPFQNVEHNAPTFLSGAAAIVGVETIHDLHQNAALKTKSNAFFVPKTAARRRSRNHRFLAAFLW